MRDKQKRIEHASTVNIFVPESFTLTKQKLEGAMKGARTGMQTNSKYIVYHILPMF